MDPIRHIYAKLISIQKTSGRSLINSSDDYIYLDSDRDVGYLKTDGRS